MVAGGAGPSGTVESVEARQVAEYARMVSVRFAPLRIDSDRAGKFRGAIRGRDLGGIEVFDVRANQHRVERTGPLAAEAPKGTYMLHLQLSGVGTLCQDGREAVLQPGDMAFYDSDRAYSLCLDDRFRNAILVFPRRLLALPAETAGQLAATRVSGSQGLARMVVPFLTRLAADLDRLPGHSSLRLAHNTVDLVATVLHGELGTAGRHRPEPEHRELLLEQGRAYIEDNLSDPSLNPQQIAAANFISVRTLHGIFSREGTSISAWIRARRLDLCRGGLSGPLQDIHPVGAVAARRGLVDASHFSRLFKSAYGESPSEFRQRLRDGQAPG
ncbi:helix-turn-helix domain-containing protein [Arthrobacter deserti]|uniref:Helix-turn-helix domain-containing protein n=1 Tax=Arthrobacter deserti TaxID=1742687 RepID=A0ABX1JNI0_9MICC|nr:helix-turn-helix domain-containing protein [Arthrobacter deserti]